MKLSTIKEYIKKNKLEAKYNESFNKNKINDPKKTFYSAYVADEFFQAGGRLEYKNYYDFLSKKIYPNQESQFIDYLKNLSETWCKKDKNLNKRDSTIYLIKQFVINPIDGKIKENLVLSKIQEHFPSFETRTPTKEEDSNECWDIKIIKGDDFFCLQVKPNSFFNSLKTTSKYSFEKINKAAKKYNNPIFLVKEYTGNIYIYIRDVNNKSNNHFINLKDFKIELLNQKQIKLLSENTFNNVNKSVDNKTKKRSRKKPC